MESYVTIHITISMSRYKKGHLVGVPVLFTRASLTDDVHMSAPVSLFDPKGRIASTSVRFRKY